MRVHLPGGDDRASHARLPVIPQTGDEDEEASDTNQGKNFKHKDHNCPSKTFTKNPGRGDFSRYRPELAGSKRGHQNQGDSYDKMTGSLGEGRAACGVHLHINNAFGTTSHNILIDELTKHGLHAWTERRDPSPPPQPGDRARLLEGRLCSQERTTAFLLHQAFQIKDDIISYLQGSNGYQHGETAARRLLENHIQTITSIIKKLSEDIEVLERQIRSRDGAAVETNFAVQTLDHKYVQGLGDLRGRVARCEASIAKLSGDISIIRHEAQRTDKEIYGLQSALKNCVGDFEKKVMQLLGKIETSSSDQSSNLKTVQGDQQHQLQLLDFKLTSILSDFRDQIQTHRKRTEVQLTRSEADQAQQRHQLLNSVKERLERAEKRVEEKLLLLSLKLEQMDKPQKYEKQLNQMKSDEKNLHARITRFERQIWKEIEEIQSEYRSGFQSVHGSLELLKQIQNTKLKLEKKKIQKDMKKIQ
ncbi:PREDICTED: protein FAM81B [Charadrius vociferus]|uniref:protein FAM81B n=1 Tax=Charadrius vociferus TaxID=50402 RepID=UPI000521B46E|nr:PREDICTED: protein FAM81B [Charadrius vociferus]